jgi:inner membrane protein involved in colicin E2 resistance
VKQVVAVPPGQTRTLEVAYDSQGLDQWWYGFGSEVNQVKNFTLTTTTDFDKVDFPQDGISPTDKKPAGKGWQLEWSYKNLLTGVRIGMEMPGKLNPGPWVGQVTLFAPVSLFLFFFLLFVFTTIRGIKVHPMNYFFLGCGFFSFHLLMAYLVDHISIHAAFAVASAVSVFLVVSYMRLVVGARVAFVEIALSQLVYLVLFSYAFFFEGYTGLTITVLCVVTLFIVMQFTGRTDWSVMFQKPAGSAPPVIK